MSESLSRKYIVETLSSLPTKRRNKNLVLNLKKFSELAERSRDLLAVSTAGCERAKLVFPAIELSNATEKISSARRKAKTCLREVSQNLEAVAKIGFENRLIEMKDHAAASIKPINDAWQKQVQDVLKPYEILVTIVAERQLKGSGRLISTLGAIRSAQNELPTTNKAALQIKQHISDLPEIVSSLGLTGKVGEFLIAVSRKLGNPRDLDNQVIRDFLDKYGLWSSLRVSFGAGE